MSNYKHLIQENAWLKEQLAVLQEAGFKRKERLEKLAKKQLDNMLSRKNMQTTPQSQMVKQWKAQAAADRERFAKNNKAELKRLPRIRSYVDEIIRNGIKKDKGPTQDLAGLGMNAADQAEVFTGLAKQGIPIIPPPNREKQLANLSRMNRENNPKPIKKS